MVIKKCFPVVAFLAAISFYFYSLKCVRENGIKNRSDPNKVAMLSESYKHMGKYEGFFFTSWTFMLQIVFVLIAILDELAKLLGLPSTLKNGLGKTRAFIFNALLFPCSLLVIVIFWSLWHVDRELIFPRAIDEFFPSWLNHVLHSFIGIPVLLEIILPKKDHFIKFKTAAITLLLYCGVYQALYFSIYLKDGVWLYPVYKVLDWPQRFIFNIIQVALILSFQFIGLSIQNRKQKKAIHTRKEKKVK